MSRKRGGLGRHTFHHAAVTTNRVDVVVEDVIAVLVIAAGEPLPGDCHPYTGGYPLSKWTSRGFDAGDPMILGMSRSFAIELPEPPNVVEGHGRLAEPFVIGVDRLHACQVEN